MPRRSAPYGRRPQAVVLPAMRLALLAGLLLVAVVLALPVLLVYAAVSETLYQRRLRFAAGVHRCPVCERGLGVAALQASDEHWRVYVTELHRAHPGARFRLVRRTRAICTACGAHLHFREASGTFALSDPHRGGALDA